MGLTVHYELSLPVSTTQEEVEQKMEALRQACRDLPFHFVDKALIIRKGDEANFRKVGKEDPYSWLLIQANTSIQTSEDHWDSCSPEVLVAFKAHPGRGTEDANFGLGLYPGANEWRWQSFCKTQYANDPRFGGLGNFLRSHLALTAALEKAKELGMLREVSDEGNYWETRDLTVLAKAVGEYDALVAGLGQSTKGADGIKVVSALDGRPDLAKLQDKSKLFDLELTKLIRLLEKPA